MARPQRTTHAVTPQPSQPSSELARALGDARALNDTQAKLMHNPHTPGVDSLTELFMAIIHASRASNPRVVEQLANDGLRMTMRAVRANDAEGECETAAIDAARRKATPAALLIHTLNRELDRIDPERMWAHRGVITGLRTEVFARVPAESLFRDSVLRGLGQRRAALLAQLHSDWVAKEDRRARMDQQPATGESRPASGRHENAPGTSGARHAR